MDNKQKSRKEILIEEIDELNHLIEDYRRLKKDCSRLRHELIQLIMELDSLEQDNEYEES